MILWNVSGHQRYSASVLILTTVVSTLGACDSIVLSERQRVVKTSHDAVCQASDYRAMRPFVSRNSVPLLDLSTSVSSMAQVVAGSALADYIATKCHEGTQTFVDEVRVRDDRYIVRTKMTESGPLTETVVVREGGVWKISLLGR